MPRLPTTLLRRASKLSPHLPTLLKVCRSLDSAQIELKWLKEHAKTPDELQNFVYRRGELNEPLQYILGTQPFGATEILCERGVLIPRAETEEIALHLAGLLKPGMKVVDLCTGTGCIPLLLAAEKQVSTVGVDISPIALSLAMKNLEHNKEVLRGRAQFLMGDVLSDIEETAYSVQACFDEMEEGHESVDVVVSNPPYISADGYNKDTARSVRLWEPKLALEADHDGDHFYPKIAEIAEALGARAIVAEVGGWEQAKRVEGYWRQLGWSGTNVWEDFAKKGRTVVAWNQGGEWVKYGPNAAQ
jgi:HemK-like putative methylase